MIVQAEAEAVVILEQSGEELRAAAKQTEREVESVIREFGELSRLTDTVLHLAGTIAECAEDEGVVSLLPKVRALGAAATQFIRDKLRMTEGVLETVKAEARLLGRLSELTRGQRSIARETQTLSVLTNIEVARLGELGEGFQYLARELDDFSQSVSKGTKELGRQAEERRIEVEETRRMLAVALPRMRQDFARIESDLAAALTQADMSLTQLANTPAQFRSSMQEIAAQIAGAVSAIQSHDITRQQLEHVVEALDEAREAIRKIEEDALDADGEMPRVLVGMRVQSFQLRNTQEAMSCWILRIRICLDGILKVSSADLIEIGPMVLEQERQLSAQLARIDSLEQECQRDSAEVEKTLSGLAGLMQLVRAYLRRSKSVRERLQLLTFNSIIEASRLGAKADGILEISQSIKRISAAWSGITDSSAQVMSEILQLVEQSKSGTEAGSDAERDGLRPARAAADEGLQRLRDAAARAAGHADQIESATEALRQMIASVASAAGRLDHCSARFGTVLGRIDGAHKQLGDSYPGAESRCEPAAAEEHFSSNYTTEIERMVLRTALYGEPMPVVELNSGGNEIELF